MRGPAKLTGFLHDGWLALRNRLIASAEFQQFSLRFPLFRPIARRQSEALFDLVAGFVYSQVMHASVETGLLELLKEPQSAEALARRMGWPPTELQLLLNAASSLGLVEQRSDRTYCLGFRGAALAAHPWIAKFIGHHDRFYADLADPVRLLKGEVQETQLRKFWNYHSDNAEAAAYTRLMAASQEAVSEEILVAHDFSRYRSILDVGGGDGSFLRRIAGRYPQISLTLFDLPQVVALAGNPQPFTAVPGHFLHDPLPRGADCVTLVRVVHDHDDGTVSSLFDRLRQANDTGTTLLIAEPMKDRRTSRRVTDAYFDLYFAAMGSGRTRSAREIAALARPAGWGSPRFRQTRLPLVASVLLLTAGDRPA
jgi:demethylspheroidene O-methyltransferase